MKTKAIALVEIAIVLCSVFLVTLPGIAADQTMQEASPSANTITTASEDDYVLGVYGNANEDDTIDMRDLTYVKLIFFGKKPETELADAKYDGKINPLDFIQIKLIIVGKEKELTYVDIFGEAETVNKPIERIADLSAAYWTEALRAIDATDMIVATNNYVVARDVFFPELSKLPLIGGSWHQPDYEAILNHNPDAVVTYLPQAAYWAGRKGEWEEKLPGVHIIALGFVNPPTGNKWTDRDKYNDLIQSTRKLGYILDKEDEAEEFCDWWGGYFNTIKSRTDQLTEDEKPRVYMGWITGLYSTPGTTRQLRICDIAGGRNIAADLPSFGEVDPEWVIEQNPDIITKNHYTKSPGLCYQVDDPSVFSEEQDSILNRPELANVDAVKNGRVYIITPKFTNGPSTILAIAYYAKWFHPELFEDLDPEEIHQEYLDRFQPIDYDLDEHGVFAYPPIEIDGGLAGIPDRYKGQI